MSKCPICGKKLHREYRDTVAGNVAEEREYCPEGHYSYEFHYGGTEYFVGNKQFGWWYSDSKDKKIKTKKLIDKEINKVKLIEKNKRED